MKKKLLIVLGAGSSLGRSMPSVADLDRLTRQWGRAWAATTGFPDYFDAVWKSIDQYYGHANPHPLLNFEKTMGEMVALSHWMEPAPLGDTLRQVACGGAPPPGLSFPPGLPSSPAPYGPTVMVTDQLKHILIELAKHMRGLCRQLEQTGEGERLYSTLLAGPRSAFDVGIYNLNYDTAALAAWPDAYTGFSETGAFDGGGVHQRVEWNFVYHLHGSVHHSLVGVFGNEIRWQDDLDAEFFDGHSGLSDDRRSEGRSFPKTTLIAGGFKLDQLLVEPFHSLHAALVRDVYRADAILIGGYGFGDEHVNRALRNRLAAPGARVPVMVLDWANEKTDPMEFRFDSWAHELCATLGAGANFFREPSHAAPVRPFELAEALSFEVNGPNRVALWYGGFLAAAQRLDGIVPWLGGEADEVLLPHRGCLPLRAR